MSDTPSNPGTGPREPDPQLPEPDGSAAPPAEPVVEGATAEGNPAEPELAEPEPTPVIEATHPSDEPPPVDLPAVDPPTVSAAPVPPVPPPSAGAPPLPPPPVPAPPGDDAIDEASESPARPRKKRTWQFAGLTVLAVGFLVGAFFLGQDSGDDAVPDATTTTVPGAAELTTFTDAETGFTIGYPEGWDALDFPPGNPLRFATSTTAGGDDGATVRVTNVGFSIGTGPDDVSVADAKAYTADLLADQGLTLVEQRDLLDGTPTFFYLYRFTDATTRQEGTHAHYFVFEGGTMTQLVFQALPTADYEELVPAFAQMVQSFTPPTKAPAAPPADPTPPESAPDSAPPASAPGDTTTSRP